MSLCSVELFSGPDFIAALAEHIPPKGFQTLRFYGYYSNKSRGLWEPIAFISLRAARAHPPVPWPKGRFPKELPEEETTSTFRETRHPPEGIPLENDMILVLEDEDPRAHDTEPVFWTD